MQENVFFFLKAKNSVKYLYDNISVEDGLALMRKHKYTAMPIINKEGVYVGTGAKIINQLEIGEYTIVGAGAVVAKTLPAHCTAVGIPAKPIKFHNEA